MIQDKINSNDDNEAHKVVLVFSKLIIEDKMLRIGQNIASIQVVFPFKLGTS